MEFYEVSPLKIVHQSHETLTYHHDSPLRAGQIVAVAVGNVLVPAVVKTKTQKPAFPTKPISRVVTTEALPSQLLKLHAWLSDYYLSHPVAVWQTMLPTGLLKKRRKSPARDTFPQRKRANIVFTKDQQNAFDSIWARPAKTSLLHGVTGSGKTAVYIELARQTLAEGRSVIVLVPEIALTSQIVADFSHHFDDIVLTHSTLTEAERHNLWSQVLSHSKPYIIIGPRSALFSPIQNLGLVIIDECHEPAYKQEKSPRYSALRAASVLAAAHKARLVLGSATPSTPDYYIASNNPGALVSMNSLASNKAVRPDVSIVDMTKHGNFSKSQFLSDELIREVREALASSSQTLLFHNRRGSAPITLCENCGWSAACPRCYIPTTLHADKHLLQCHVCDYKTSVPTACPDCDGAHILHKGIGTKRVETEVLRLFPEARVARFDGDNDQQTTVEKSYQSLYDGDIDIIIGTQVIAKGLDLPKLRLVGIVQADSGLALPDYQSSERVFQLVSQVCGRVGRNEHSSKVILQSYQPTHPSVVHGVKQNYAAFYDAALSERRRSYFPPFCYLLKATCVYRSEAAAIRASRELAANLKRHCGPNDEILGPAPSFYERARDTYRWQVVCKSSSRARLMELAKLVPQSRWQFELDPISLL